MKTSDIQIRDPFIVPMPDEGRYYLYGSTDKNIWTTDGATGFDLHTSTDLENWDGPFPVFRPAPEFWGKHQFWAPEVHRYQGRWFMFATFKADGRCRGTQILVSDSLRGSFVPVSPDPITPSDWECLDGTLYVDGEGAPWIVFCHEWVQIRDGSICAMQLAPDLTKAVTSPIPLFHGSNCPWVTDRFQKQDHITDGPFLFRNPADPKPLYMLWSSCTPEGYSEFVAVSDSGDILGPWRHDHPAISLGQGGHGMIFTDFAGNLRFTCHQPNDTPNERARFSTMLWVGGRLSAIPEQKES